MSSFVAKRLRFQDGERFSFLSRPGGLPVHEVVLYLARFRTRGRAANTIHAVCMSMALLYRELDKAGIQLLERLRHGQFLTVPEVNRLADAAQYRLADLSEDDADSSERLNVVDIRKIRIRRQIVSSEYIEAVDVATQASRIRYMADFLGFIADYYGATLPSIQRQELATQSAHVLKALQAQVPRVARRAKLGAREGLSQEEQERLLAVVHPDSPDNPWKQRFVRSRNWLIVTLLLATGMRRGELLGLQINDLIPNQPCLRIMRRADAAEDPRLVQANTKTRDRIVEVRPTIMKAIWYYIREDRHKIKAARRFPQIFVADDGQPLSAKSIDKIFVQIRQSCPGLPVTLTSHVMRHTWNERFSEQAEKMGLTDTAEERARNEQQGWTDNSKSGAVYTRRHTSRKGREIALRLQEGLDESGG